MSIPCLTGTINQVHTLYISCTLPEDTLLIKLGPKLARIYGSFTVALHVSTQHVKLLDKAVVELSSGY